MEYQYHALAKPLKPNSITLAGSKLVPASNPTSFEPASVMEFGFYGTSNNYNNRTVLLVVALTRCVLSRDRKLYS